MFPGNTPRPPTLTEAADDLVRRLQAVAPALGIDPSRVVLGEFGKGLPALAPWVYAFVLPGVSEVEEGGRIIAVQAEAAVYFGAAPAGSTAEAANRAVETAGQALAYLLEKQRRWSPPERPLALDSYDARLAVARLDLSCRCRLPDAPVPD